jgi:hypothetical protein
MSRTVTATCPNCGRDTEVDLDEMPTPTDVIRRALHNNEAFIIHAIRITSRASDESLIYQYGIGADARFYISDEITFCRGRLLDRHTAQSKILYPLP